MGCGEVPYDMEGRGWGRGGHCTIQYCGVRYVLGGVVYNSSGKMRGGGFEEFVFLS